jgi:hypothetical protein
MLPPAVLWIDPGGMTGLARYEHGQFTVDERPFEPACGLIWYMTAYYGPRLWVGWERYKPLPGKPQTNAADALEVIGVARFSAIEHDCVVLPEAAPGDRLTATMARLKAIGWWAPGKDDAQSAAQHMLAWMERVGEVPPREREILRAARTARGTE